MNNIDVNLIDDLQDLRNQKEELENSLKAVNAELEEVEKQVIENFVNSEVDSVKRNGKTYSLKNETFASAIAEEKDNLFAALRNNEAGELVQETVNANSLRAFVKELKTNNDGNIPEWILPFITVFEKTKISVRKGA